MDEQQPIDISALYQENLQSIIATVLPKAIQRHGEPHTISVAFGFKGATVTYDIRVFTTEDEPTDG